MNFALVIYFSRIQMNRRRGDEIQRSMDKTQIPTRRIMLFPLTRIASISITATSSNYIVTSIASLDAIN